MVRAPFVALIVLASVPSIAAAQEKPSERDIRKGYIVEVIGEAGKVVETVGAFLTPKEADDAEKAWNANHPKTLLLTRVREGDVEVKRQPAGKPKSPDLPSSAAGPKGSTITMPVIIPVDPGPRTSSGKNPDSVAGKKGSGKIGNYSVTVEFQKSADQNGGDLVISGDLTGTGKWTQTGKAVTMETKISKFQGVIDGNTISGVRVKRDEQGKVVQDKWDVDFSKKANNAQEKYTVIFYQEGREVYRFDHYKDLAEASKSARGMVEKNDRRLGIRTEVLNSAGKVVARFTDGEGDQ